MGIFTKIFNFDKEKLEALEFRNNSRYAPNDHFPINTSVRIKKRNIPAKIHNISKGGMALKIPKNSGKIQLNKNDPLEITIGLFDQKTTIFAKVSHFNQETIGVQLDHTPLAPLLEYHQLIYPILIGRSMSEHSSSNSLQTVYTGMEESKMIFTKNLHQGLSGEFEKVEIMLLKDKIKIEGIGPAPIKLIFTHLDSPHIPIKNQDAEYQHYFQFYKWFLLHLDTTFSHEQLNFLKNVGVHS